MTQRPVISIPLSPLSILMLVAGGILVILQWVVLLKEYGGLPEVIPSHFNGRGEVDGHASKSFLYLLPVITTFLFGTMAILYRFPHKMNYPVAVTPQNANTLYRLSVNLVCYIAFTIALSMFYLSYQTIQVAKGNATGLGSWSLVILLVMMMGPLMYAVARMFKMK